MAKTKIYTVEVKHCWECHLWQQCSLGVYRQLDSIPEGCPLEDKKPERVRLPPCWKWSDTCRWAMFNSKGQLMGCFKPENNNDGKCPLEDAPAKEG